MDHLIPLSVSATGGLSPLHPTQKQHTVRADGKEALATEGGKLEGVFFALDDADVNVLCWLPERISLFSPAGARRLTRAPVPIPRPDCAS
jgi:hypothetical protein